MLFFGLFLFCLFAVGNFCKVSFVESVAIAEYSQHPKSEHVRFLNVQLSIQFQTVRYLDSVWNPNENVTFLNVWNWNVYKAQWDRISDFGRKMFGFGTLGPKLFGLSPNCQLPNVQFWTHLLRRECSKIQHAEILHAKVPILAFSRFRTPGFWHSTVQLINQGCRYRVN